MILRGCATWGMYLRQPCQLVASQHMGGKCLCKRDTNAVVSEPCELRSKWPIIQAPTCQCSRVCPVEQVQASNWNSLPILQGTAKSGSVDLQPRGSGLELGMIRHKVSLTAQQRIVKAQGEGPVLLLV